MRASRFQLGRRSLSTLVVAAMLNGKRAAWADVAIVEGAKEPSEAASPHAAAALSDTLFDQVFAGLVTANPQPVVFSPLCLADALNLLLAGAAGKTGKHLSDIKASLLDQANRDQVPNNPGTESALRRVSALWLAKDINPGPAATQTMPLPESADEAVRKINQWASQNTDGLVPTILDRLPPHSPLVVASALHFGDRWRARFDPKDTSLAAFRRASQPVVKVPVMRGVLPCKYARFRTLHAVLMPYVDEQFEFLAIAPVPDSDPNQIVSLCRKGKLSSVIRRPAFDQISAELVDVRMPRFDLSFVSDLHSSLQRTSLAPMFEAGADFSGLTADTPVRPSAVIQRVVMRVDETGTEAAAATAIPTDRSYRQPPSFVADAPFLAVVLSKSGMPVVAALVTDPSRSTA